MKKYHEIHIIPKIGGWLVKVGCMEIIFANIEINNMIQHLEKYYNEPEEMEKWYRDKYPEFFEPKTEYAPPTSLLGEQYRAYQAIRRANFINPIPDNGDKA